MKQTIVNLKNLVDNVVTTNIAVQDTLEAKQIVLDSVADAQGLVDSLDGTVANKKTELDVYTDTQKTEIETVKTNANNTLLTTTNNGIADIDAAALNRTTQYDNNHTTKLASYNANDATKLAQYNDNHVARLELINFAYADRIVDLLNSGKMLGMVDKFTASVTTNVATFLSTSSSSYFGYYVNGVKIETPAEYTILDETRIQLTTAIKPYDVVTQIDMVAFNDILLVSDALTIHDKAVPDGVATLNSVGQVPSEQLPSYVDDVLEYATYADLPVSGESGKIYVVVTDETSGGDVSTYRWSGTAYAKISDFMTASDIKTLYESNLDTNAYTDAEKLKVSYVSVTQNVDLDTIESDTALNTTHRTSTGEDHTYINQDVTTTATPTFAGIVTGGLVDGRDVSVDGTKLDTIAAGAEVNQNAFSNIAVSGQTTVAADGKTDTLTLVAGTNINITTDAVTDTITIAANDTSVDWSEVQNKPDPVITVTLTGDVTGSANTTLTDLASGTVSVSTTIAANSVALGTDTIGNYVASITNGTYITGANGGSEGAALTLAVDATSTNTASKVVARDVSGDFSANIITASLNGNATTASAWQTGRTITLTGGVTGTSTALDGSSDISFATTVANDSHNHTASTITAATTAVAGVVQLNDTLTSTSTTLALTANQGKVLQDTKAPLVSPSLTGTPLAPTATADTNTTQIATTAFVQTAINAVVEW